MGERHPKVGKTYGEGRSARRVTAIQAGTSSRRWLVWRDIKGERHGCMFKSFVYWMKDKTQQAHGPAGQGGESDG